MKTSHLISAALVAASCVVRAAGPADTPSTEQLGRLLFFDANLSRNRSQSCASCHDPAHGFADARDNGVAGAVSLGDDGRSLGDRNAPSAAYAAFSPAFHRNADGEYLGGQFWDGREPDLAGQAGGPPLNPIEMALPDKATVVARLKQNPVYVQGFKARYGEAVFDEVDSAYRAMTESIAAYERSTELSPFDSKYDRHLRGSYQMTPQEELGMTLFFSQQFTNCNQCHQLKPIPGQAGETFSNYRYHNIGVPKHTAVRVANGKGQGHVDRGLAENPAVHDPAATGRFKVPTLRNVAVTAPYMHNGVFAELRTVVLFYNKYNSRNPRRQINPETGMQWAAPEVADNLSRKELEHGPALDDKRVDALVAFLKTLTDRRYEHLLGAP